MATRINTNQVLDEGITRADVNATTTGKALIKKIIQGTNVTISSTGVDSGTGDVTINVNSIPWNIVTGRATTLSGYGITDAATATHTHTFASLTSKPTTLVGYGITDAATSTHNHDSSYLKLDASNYATSVKVKGGDVGGWAMGLLLYDASATTMNGGIGQYGNGTTLDYVWLGVGTSPWTTKNLMITPDGNARFSHNLNVVGGLTHSKGLTKTGEHSGYGGTYVVKNPQSYSAWGNVTGSIGFKLNSPATVVKVTFKIASPSWNAAGGFQTLEVGIYEGNTTYSYANLTNPTNYADIITEVRIATEPDGSTTILLNPVGRLWEYPMVIVDEVLHGGQAANLANWAAPSLVTSHAAYSSVSAITLTSKLSNHTHTFASLTSKPTTLAGYGITDAAALSGATFTGPVIIKNLVDIGGDNNGNIEIGGRSGTVYTTPFIDFHTGHATNDYDVRLIALGNNGAIGPVGGAHLNVLGGGLKVNGVDVSLSTHTHTFASLTSKPTTLTGYGITDAVEGSYLVNRTLSDYNTAAPAGINTYYGHPAAPNKPSGNDHAVLKLAYNASWSFDIAGDWRTDNMFIRGMNNGAYGPWRQVWHSGIFDAGNAVQYGMIVQARNSFNEKKLYQTQLNNALFLANKRWTVTGVIYNADGSVYNANYDVSALFNANYEDLAAIPAGKKLILTIDFGGDWPGYPYGRFFISYYYVNWPATASMRVYCNYEPQGIGWKAIPITDYVRQGQTLVQQGYNGYYGINKVEFTITAPAGDACYPSEIEWGLDRPTSEEMPYFDKLAANNIYAPVFFKNGANVTTSTLSGSGFDLNVPLTLLGNNSLIFKSDDPGDIIFMNSAGVENGRIWKAGSSINFSLSSSPNTTFHIAQGAVYVDNNAVWHAGNFNPSNYATVTNTDLKNYLKFADTRSVNSSPNSVVGKFNLDFKYRATLGVPGADTYGGLLTIAPWTDGSGGSATQIFAGQDGLFYRRENMNAASWTDPWHEILAESKYLEVTNVEKNFGWKIGAQLTYFFGNGNETRTIGIYDTEKGTIWNWSALTNTFKVHSSFESVGGFQAGTVRGYGSWSTQGWGPSMVVGAGSHGIFFPSKGSSHSAFIGKTADNFVRIMGKSGDDLAAPGTEGFGAPIHAFTVDVSNGNAAVSGTMSAAGGFYQTSSREVKENIRPVEFNALELIKETRIVNFNYISDETKEERIGFIAEDTPEELSGTDRKQFRNSDTIAVLIKAVQELTARVEELENASE